MAEIARDSIGEGIIIAQQLPPSFAHELIKEVNIAFINAFNVVGIILGIIMLILAGVIMYVLPPFKAFNLSALMTLLHDETGIELYSFALFIIMVTINYLSAYFGSK